MFLGAGEGAHQDALVACALHDRRRRHAQRVHEQPDGMAEGDVEKASRAAFAHVVRIVVAALPGRPKIGGIDAMLGEQAGDMPAMLGGDARLEVGRRQPTLLVLHLVGDQQVDAVGLAVDVLVDPFEIDFQALRGVGDGAQHAEAAGVRHRRHDVAAMAESEQGKLDSELPAQSRLHPTFPLRQDANATRKAAGSVAPPPRPTLSAGNSAIIDALSRRRCQDARSARVDY